MAGLIALMAIGCGEDRRAPGKEYWLLVEIYPSTIRSENGWGLRESVLRVPDDRDARVRLRAHGAEVRFEIEGLGVSASVSPGQEVQVVFRPPAQGDYRVSYGARTTRLHVVPGPALGGYETCPWTHPPYAPEDLTQAEWGEQLFAGNGCPACHHVEPQRGVLVGPNLGGLFGTTQALEGGGSALVDSAYVVRSIREPDEDIAAGFTHAAMPPYALSDRPLLAIVAYLASLSDPADCSVCDPAVWELPDRIVEHCPPPDYKFYVLAGVPRKLMLAR